METSVFFLKGFFLAKFLKPARRTRASRRRFPAYSGVVGPSYITTCHCPAFLRATMRRSSKFGTAGPSTQPPGAQQCRRRRRRPAHPQTVSNARSSLRSGNEWCLMCQVRASATARLVVGCRLRLLSGFWHLSARVGIRRLGLQVSTSREDYRYQEHAARDSCLGCPPAREPSDRPKLPCFMCCRSLP